MPRTTEGIPRILEASLAVCCLLLTSPLLLLVVIAVRMGSRGPVLFRQTRVGRGGRTFVLYKFRTMRTSSAGPYVTAEDDRRITPVGRFLRKTKLDELPELWNVLRGDMALVGPRPEVPHYVDREDPAWRFVLQYRPGITDPVTLRLRNEEKLLAGIRGDREKFYREILQPFKLRGYEQYLVERTCWSDFAVLWQTGLAIAFPQRVSPPSIPEFRHSGIDQPATSHHSAPAHEDLPLASAVTEQRPGTTASR